MMEPKAIFVSHHHSPEEDAFTARLVDDLQHAGAKVWVDVADIQHGDFLERINAALASCQWVVLVLTPEALRSQPVRTEVNAALNLTWQGRIRAVIPVMAKECDPAEIPPTWANLQRYDATREYTHALIGLLRAVELLSPVAPISPPMAALPDAAIPHESAPAHTVQPASPPPESEPASVAEATTTSAAQPTPPPSQPASPLAQSEPLSIAEATASSAAQAPAADAPVPASAQPAQSEPASSQPVTAELPTRIVDASGLGQHRSIAQAIRAAQPGERLLIRRGAYKEEVEIDKPIELVGEGSPGDVKIEGLLNYAGRSGIRIRAKGVHLSNLSFSQDEDHHLFTIWSGAEVQIDRCVFTAPKQGVNSRQHEVGNPGRDAGGVVVKGTATIRHSRLHSFGVHAVRVDGTLLLEDSEITGCKGSAVKVVGSATVRRTRIAANAGCAIEIAAGGSGTFEDNDLRGNGGGAWCMYTSPEKVQRTGNQE